MCRQPLSAPVCRILTSGVTPVDDYLSLHSPHRSLPPLHLVCVGSATASFVLFNSQSTCTAVLIFSPILYIKLALTSCETFFVYTHFR